MTTSSGSTLIRGPWLIAALALALPCMLVAHIATGAVAISPVEVIGGLQSYLLGDGTSQAAMIVGQLRLPRGLLAALVGALLAMSGAAMQGLFRNPLADPSLIGVTAGASLGASVAILASGGLVAGWLGTTVISIGAFAGGLVAVIVVYRLATAGTTTSVPTMLLAGIAITALAGAIGNILDFHATNATLRRISLWRMGGLDGATWTRVAAAAVVGSLVCGVLPRFASALNGLLLGESEARYLGIDITRVKARLIVLVAIGVGAAVALAGTIAFVGLVVPHIVRLLVGPDHRILMPAAGLAGALLLLVADLVARVALAPVELPVGVVTALVGVPFFIALLRTRSAYGLNS